MFSRNVRFQVDISAAPGERDPASTFCLTFTLVSGECLLFIHHFLLLLSLIKSPFKDLLKSTKIKSLKGSQPVCLYT